MRATTSREQVQQDSPPKAQSIYSIPSSAVASRVSGTVTPSVFADLEVDDHLVRKHRSTREGEALMAATAARVLSVNVGAVREFEYNGRPAKSGIWKSPVAGRIAARGINLDGDEQADRKAHGGPDKVIYAYAVEDARWWEQEIDRPLGYGERLQHDIAKAGIGHDRQPTNIGNDLAQKFEPFARKFGLHDRQASDVAARPVVSRAAK